MRFLLYTSYLHTLQSTDQRCPNDAHVNLGAAAQASVASLILRHNALCKNMKKSSKVPRSLGRQDTEGYRRQATACQGAPPSHRRRALALGGLVSLVSLVSLGSLVSLVSLVNFRSLQDSLQGLAGRRLRLQSGVASVPVPASSAMAHLSRSAV